MNKIEVGEYVRTKEGYIGILIEHIPNALNYLKIDVGKEIRRDNGMSDNYIYTRYGFQLKHSKQLIDLIENKDILKLKASDNKEVFFIGIDEDTSDIKYKELIENIENGENELLEILTHEQFEANCYKVGGE